MDVLTLTAIITSISSTLIILFKYIKKSSCLCFNVETNENEKLIKYLNGLKIKW